MIKYSAEFIDAALSIADGEHSKITEREKELYGLSSRRLRDLLNILCSKDDTKYLELGVYRGATLISAVFGNKNCKAVGVESFKYEERELQRWAPNGGIWPNMQTQLDANILRYKESNAPVDTDNITIIQDDFEKVDLSGHGKFNVCFFDITPATADSYKAFFSNIMPHMANDCLVVFSNYSNEINASALTETLESQTSGWTVETKRHRISSGLSDATKYYSGILIVHFKKSILKGKS